LLEVNSYQALLLWSSGWPEFFQGRLAEGIDARKMANLLSKPLASVFVGIDSPIGCRLTRPEVGLPAWRKPEKCIDEG